MRCPIIPLMGPNGPDGNESEDGGTLKVVPEEYGAGMFGD